MISKKRVAVFILINLLLLTAGASVFAKPQPDFTFFGTASVNGVPLTQSDTDTTITLEVEGVELARYTMGDNPAAGDYYVLIVPMDDDPTVTNKGFPGDSALVYINDNPVDENPLTLGNFGQTLVQNIDATISGLEPEIDVSPVSRDYGDVSIGSSLSLSVTITNTGTANLDVSSIALGAGTSADFAITSAPASILLAPGANVTVQVTYSPSDEGTDSGTLVIGSNDSDEPTVTVSLSGNGVPSPVAEIDVTPPALNYGDVFIGSDSALSVTITNTGTADLDVTSIALGVGTSADFAITSGPASLILAPGANTTVQITYSPSDEGTDSGTLIIGSDDTDEPTVTVSLSGNGVPVPVPEIEVTPLSLNYGDVYIGSDSTLSVTITNTGTANLDVSSIALGVGTSGDFAITSGPASIVLSPGANTTVQVTYSPSDEGADSGTVLIESDDADEAVVTVSLSGNGVPVPVPEIDVTPLSLNYGDVYIGSDSTLSVTITNTGTADLDVSSVGLGVGTSGDFAITSGPATVILAPGANATVQITYSPSDEGTDSGTLVIESDDTDEPTVTVSLSGNGVPVPVPEIDVTPLTLNYGDVFIGSDSALSVTITNTGTADLDVSSIGLGAGTSADFAITSGPASVILAPGANATVQITYSPSDEGTDSGTLIIGSDDTDEPTVTVSLSGNGVPVPVPEIDVTPLSLNYGDVFIGSDSTLSVTITNTGTADLDVSSIALGVGTSGDFAITSGPANILLIPGANVTVQITYSPSDEGTDSGTLVIDSDDTDEPVVTVSLNGNGVPVPVPEIDVTPLSLNYGDVFIGSDSTLSVTITNTGTADLDVSSIALGVGTSADFAITSGPANIVLIPGANATVQVTYSPSDDGADSGTVVIESDDSDEPTVTVSLSGNGVPVPVPEMDVTPLSLNYGDVFIGSDSVLIVTITNTGTANLDVGSIALGGGTSADFAITSGPGSILLAPGANVTVQVTYSPSDEGADSGTLVIESDDADEGVVTVSLSGNGVPVPVPEINVTPLSLNYSDVFIGSDSTFSVTITNAGTANLDVSTIALGAGTSADFAITSGPASIVLAPGANTTVQVTYSPSDEGADSGTLVIASDDSDEPTVTVSLSGNGVPVPVPEIDVTPLSLNYGDVFIGSDSVLSVTITNTGTADLDVSSIALGVGTSGDFAITSGPGSIMLAPGANTTVQVTFSPSDEGTDSGTVLIASDDSDEPTVTVSLSGDGVPVPVPEIDVTPLSLNYGDVFIGSDSALSVTITNTGTADLDVTSIGLGVGTSGDFAITSGPASVILAPGANTTVQVTYSPLDEGADSGTLVIGSDDADEAVVTVSLSGNGVPVPVPEIDVTPLSLNYGDVYIGSDSTLSVTITNTGTADLGVTSIAFGAGTSADFAITSGPANILLIPGANVTVQVTYSPSDEGTDSGTLVIDSDDSDEPKVTVSLSGNGVPVPVAEIDVSPLALNYGDVFIGSDSTLSVTITNTGTADLDVTSIALGAGTSADFAITSGPGSIVLAPGANVTVQVTYSPSDEGADSGTLVIGSDDADEPVVTVSLSGNGVPVPVAAIEVTPLALNYGDVFIGSNSALSVTITNTGTADLDVSSIALGVGTSGDFAITSGPGSILLAPGANVTVQVTYSPSDEGTDSGTLVIESNDSDAPTVTVSLSGNGVPVPVPEIDVTPLSLNYGDVFIGSDSTLSVTITNTGTADLDVSSIGLGVGTSGDFAITSGPSNIVLVPGANTTVQVTYSPSDEGADSGTLVIGSDDTDEPVVTVSLSGNGVPVPVPEIDVTPLAVNYGDVFIGSDSALSVSITNAGTADLDVTSIALGVGTSGDFAITSGPASVILAPGANATVQVTYSPSDGGADSGTLVIGSDDTDEPVVTVSLSGNGVPVPVPEIDVTPLSLNYGDVFIGSNSALSVTITNTGTANLDVGSIALGGGTSADFAITSGLGSILLAPGANVTVQVTYSPSDEGADSGTLVIGSDDADEPTVTVSLSGNGVPVPVPEIDVSPLALNYGDVFIGSDSKLSVTITNTGTADLDVTSIALGVGTSADFVITLSPGSVLLAPGANVTVQVTYSPSDEGTDSGTLVIESDDSDEPKVTVSLSGNGVPVPVPEIDVTPLSLTYGDVYIGSDSTLSVTITNTGTADLDVTSIAFGAGTSADFAITSGPGSILLAPGANVRVQVTYSPSDEVGDSGTLVIESDDADEPTVTISLSGNGVPVPVPEIDVTPLSLNYGNVFIGSESMLSVTITNTGTADLDVSNVTLGAGTSTDFAITSGPANVILAPGANVTLQVTYSPSDEGADSGTLVIESDDSDEPTVTVSLSGNGVPLPVPEIDVTPLSLNYGDVFIGSDSVLSVTITNTGSADLDVTSIALGAGSADFAITSGPGSIVLAPGTNVTVQATYSPSDEGADSGTLVIESDDTDEPVVTVSLNGRGVPVPIAEIDVTPLALIYGDVFIGSSLSQTVTIDNVGTANLDITDIRLGAGSSLDFLITSGPSVPMSVAPGAYVTVGVTYSPSDEGADSGTLVIGSDDADEAVVIVSLNGNGVPTPVPEIDVTPLSLNYGDVFVGFVSVLSVSVTNTGSADLDVTGIALGMGSSGDFAVTSGPESIVLGPGANVTVWVTYSPLDEGPDSGTLVIESDDTDEPVVTVSLLGNGVPAPIPEIDITPLSLNYGDVFIGLSLSKTVSISNAGTANLNVTNIELEGGSSLDFEITSWPSLPASIVPGANITVQVTYRPLNEGVDSGTLLIESDDFDEPVVTVSLSGNGVPVPVPEIDVAPLSLNYGDVFIGSDSTLSVTITNTGSADLDVTSIALGASSSADFVITSGPGSIVLVPGANVTVEVNYSPSDEGADSGTLLIESDDFDEPVVTVSLSGNGVPVPVPEIDVAPLSLNYGDVFIGSDSTLSVTITNTGSADLDVTSIALGASSSADFVITSGPGSIVLVPGANVTVEVNYSPSDEGADSGTLVIQSDDADESVVILSLSGIGIKMCGDLDEDGDVDVDDYLLFRSAYGKQTGDPDYIVEADFDKDGVVGLPDFYDWYSCYWNYLEAGSK